MQAITASAPASSLESQIATHRSTLLSLYTRLTSDPSPSQLVDAELDALQLLLVTQLESQRTKAQLQVTEAETRLETAWVKVRDWRAALGEQDPAGAKARESSALLPLTTQVEQVERVLEGMRTRMQERGKAIVRLHRRLREFVPVLGTEWVQVKLEDCVTEDSAANNDDEWDKLEDLRLERLSELEREVMRCEAELAHRRDLIIVHVNEIFALRSELGIHQAASRASLPSSTPVTSSGLVRVPEPDTFDEAILSHLGVGDERAKVELPATEETIKRLEAKRKWLEEEKNSRNMTIQTTYDKLYPLWTMLGVSEQEMEDFVNCWMGSTTDVVNAYESELARMMTLKRSNLSAFITREREHLTVLWDALYLSPAQRLSTFPPIAINVAPTLVWNEAMGQDDEVVNDNVSEELLVAHERERERLEAEVERSRPVLERLAKYFAVVEEMAQLEASASDPSRLLGKSTRGDPGRLLREEKARKRVQKDKPRLELELLQFIPQWENEMGRRFEVNGVRFLDQLEERMEVEASKGKDAKKRSTTIPARTTAPLKPQATGSSHTVAPLKRQMTGRSTTSSASASSSGPSAAKRQTPMPTGGGGRERARSVLGDHSNHVQPLRAQHTGKTAAGVKAIASQPTGSTRAALGHSTSSSAASGPSAAGAVDQTQTGMRIPAGWGGFAAGAVQQPGHLTSVVGLGGAGIVGAAGGGFRPRSSASGR